MSKARARKPPGLSGKQIHARVARRLRKYERRNRLEQVAMYLGSAQLLEVGLKQVAADSFGLDLEEMERWTMGKLKTELNNHGCRPDFIALLDSVVKQRNDIAHSMLAEEATLRVLLRRSTGHLVWRRLERAIYEIEQLMILFEWTEKHTAWIPLSASGASSAQVAGQAKV